MKLNHISAPEWLELKVPENVEIAPESSQTFFAKATTFSMREAQSSPVTVQTNLGDVSLLMMVIAEMPALATTPSQMEYWAAGQSVLQDYVVEIYPPSGHLGVRSLRDPGTGWLVLRTRLSEPILISKEAPLKILVQLDSQRLSGRQASRAGEKLKGRLDVEYEGPHGVQRTPLWLNFDILRPPEITLAGEHGQPRTLLQTKEQPLTFTFSNATDADPVGGRQNARLEIKSAALRLQSAQQVVNPQLLSLLPLELAGADSGTVDFQANLQSLPPGIHYFELQITTNRRELDRTYRVPVQVRAMEVFDGVVAIDFGTSNTCCALLSAGADYQNVPLDEQRTTAPTLVRYLDLSGPEPLTETGTRVKHLAAVDEKVASSTVSRLKQLLGETNYPLTVLPMKASEWVTREAREAAADYLHHIRSVAEKQQSALCDNFILTHPASVLCSNIGI